MAPDVVCSVVFDLDGVLVDSEQWWDAIRRGVAAEAGRPWPTEATRAMQGMSTAEWSAYLTDTVGIPAEPEEMAATVVDRMAAQYDARLPLLPGAVEVVGRLAGAALAPGAHLGLTTAANRHRVGVGGVSAPVSGQRLHRGGGVGKALACGVSDRGAPAGRGPLAGGSD
jgi:beta-phosphoglucomutase-like phosphatase (HAD superfamily)